MVDLTGPKNRHRFLHLFYPYESYGEPHYGLTLAWRIVNNLPGDRYLVQCGVGRCKREKIFSKREGRRRALERYDHYGKVYPLPPDNPKQILEFQVEIDNLKGIREKLLERYFSMNRENGQFRILYKEWLEWNKERKENFDDR